MTTRIVMVVLFILGACWSEYPERPQPLPPIEPAPAPQPAPVPVPR